MAYLTPKALASVRQLAYERAIASERMAACRRIWEEATIVALLYARGGRERFLEGRVA